MVQGMISVKVDGGVADVDIAYYAKESRLTEPSDGKRYEWRKMIELSKELGRTLTDEETEEFRIE